MRQYGNNNNNRRPLTNNNPSPIVRKKYSANNIPSSNSFQNTINSHQQSSFLNSNRGNNNIYMNNSNNQNHNNSANINNNFNQTYHHNTSLNLNNNPMEAKIFNKKSIQPIVIDTSGHKPFPRFGQSIVSLNNVKIILFGGAVGDIRNFKYSNEIYIFNLMTKIWKKIIYNNLSIIPKERAAHAAASNNDNQMAIHGGSIGGSTLAEDELWIFDLKGDKNNNNDVNSEGIWKLIKTTGNSPGKRYGHTLSYMKPYFILFGGNSNPNLKNDVWIIDIETNNNNNVYSWNNIKFLYNVGPSPRLYHSSGYYDKGNNIQGIIIFGGRDSKENPLNDIWCLHKGYEGGHDKWEWMRAVISSGNEIKPRYNHSICFYNNLMIIIGGRSHYNYHNPLPIEVYNLDNFESYEFPGIGMNRQSSFIFDKYIYLYGGFNEKNSSQPLGILSKISLENLFEGSPLINEIKVQNNKNITKNNKVSHNSSKRSKFKLSHEVVIGSGGVISPESEENEIEDTSVLFRKISIDKLQEENKRIGENNSNVLLESVHNFDKNLINLFIDTLLRPFDWYDSEKMDKIHSDLPFTQIQIFKLLKEVKPILEKEKSLIKIRSPCKIFGNLYGCYNDLMRFFESFGNPSDDNQMGDINVMQYLFLGDFCDRGLYSLEIILLLFALKVKYPDFIYIIRGHHEDSNVNFYYGLGQECKERLGDDITNSKGIFCLINKIFDILPFGILIDNNILCIHGGIGSSINTLEDIENIKRPISVIQEVTNTEHQKILDLLWSEFSQDIVNVDINSERDILKNGFIVKYGKERLNKFLNDNKINLLITSHMFIKDGFKTFNNDKLLTVYSATNYMDKYRNIGGMIIIAKKTKNKPMNILPKLINIYEGKKENFRKDRNPSPIH